jgi:hypothetical protein
MKTWERKGYFVKKIEFDYDLHIFQIIKDNKVIATITLDTIEDIQQIVIILANILKENLDFRI